MATRYPTKIEVPTALLFRLTRAHENQQALFRAGENDSHAENEVLDYVGRLTEWFNAKQGKETPETIGYQMV